MTKTRSHRIAKGTYETPDGFQVTQAFDGDMRPDGWHVIDPNGEWCNTYPTKRAALNAAEDIALVEDYR